MPSRILPVACKNGLHAQPASLLVRAAEAAGISVTIGRPGEKAIDAASLLMVLALGVKCGEKVEISVAEAPNADLILAEISRIISTN